MADSLKFTEDHLWVRVEGNRAHIGVSVYGQGELGEVLAVELPDVGDELEKGEPFGEVESTGTVTEIISPLSGAVVSTNAELDDLRTTGRQKRQHNEQPTSPDVSHFVLPVFKMVK